MPFDFLGKTTWTRQRARGKALPEQDAALVRWLIGCRGRRQEFFEGTKRVQAKPFHPAICAAVLAASSLVAAQSQPVADGPVAQAREQGQAKKSAQPQQVQQAQQAQVAGQGFVFLDEVVSKSPGDKAEYRAIQLDNGMTVLLASDPQANKSLMAAALPVGSMDDPDTQLGLAHYLEHMVLLGSKNYPETGGLDAFLQKHGGRNNASTSGRRTAYYLEVNHQAFDEAVARLADALAFPLLLPGNAQKELSAVHAEMVRAKSNDGYLLHGVNRATANPQHPASRFSVGNRQTLVDKPGSKLHDELVSFHHRYYSANLFKAVLYSNRSIGDLARLAAATLGRMPDKKIDEPRVNVPLYRDEDKGVVMQYKPIRPVKTLAMSFAFANEEHAFRRKTGTYLAYLLSHKGAGTLSDYLITEGLSDSGVHASNLPKDGRNSSQFTIHVQLTDKGWAQRDQVIALIFGQLANIRREGVQEAYYQELQESLRQSFQHLQVKKDMGFVMELADSLLLVPVAHVLDADFVAESLDRQAVAAKLAGMTPENARILLVSETVQADRKTPHMEAPYAIAPITAEQKARWANPATAAALQLPPRNPYFATDFSINTAGIRRKAPALIARQPGLEIYSMPSRHFADDPKVAVSLLFSLYPYADDIRQAAAASALGYMNTLAQARQTFQAGVAGMRTRVALSDSVLAVNAGGYAQHLAHFTQDYIRQFATFPLTESYLAQAKQYLLESLAREEKADSQTQAQQALHRFASYPYFEIGKQRQAIEQLTLQDVQHFRHRLLSEASGLKVLAVGNFSDRQVQDLAAAARATIKHRNGRHVTGRYVDINQTSRKLNYSKSVPHEDNALSVAYFPRGHEEHAGAARAALLGSIIGRWYFHDLRTDKQLGYSVAANVATIGKTSGLQFSVQSPQATPAEIMRHNLRFFAESHARLQQMPEAEFAQFRHSLAERLEHKPDSLSEEIRRYANDFIRGNSRFDEREKLIAAVKKLTKQDVLAFYRQALIEQNGLVFASQALGRQAGPQDAAQLPGFEQIGSIEQLQKEFAVKEY